MAGASGSIGSVVVPALLDRGHEVVGVDLPGRGAELAADLTDPAAADEVVGRTRPDGIVHLAGIPDELLEAARVDGAGELRIFTTVVVPLLKPIVATLAVFSFLGTWNDFMWPLIVLTDDSLHTLPVALAGLSREHVQDNELMMAGSVITVLPVLVLFLALQRQYMAGLMAGSVKG